MLTLSDRWIWDFWLARDDDELHAFYLQAPRSLGDPEARHHHATIGHARSTDSSSWQPLPDALGPGAPGAWDDLATWTGSVLRHDGTWHMLYTGIGAAERGLVQRIGVARSDDLLHWTKHPGNPVLEADPRWYETLEQGRWRDQSWRDPWAFWDETLGAYRVLVTARARSGPVDGAGVIGAARTEDFEQFEALPPLASPGEFAQMEVPQLVHLDDRVRILFSCLDEDHAAVRRDRLGGSLPGGTYVLSAPDLDGPFEASTTPLLARDADGTGLYAAKIVEGLGERPVALAFRGWGPLGFAGELTDPLPLRHDARGNWCAGPARESEDHP